MLMRVLHLEGLGIIYGLAVAIVFQLLTRRINLSGLLRQKDGSGEISPERIQLLLATIAGSARFIGSVATTKGATLPDISNGWLYLLGGSSSAYVIGKAWNFWKVNRARLGGE
jgi:hypothetical protein